MNPRLYNHLLDCQIDYLLSKNIYLYISIYLSSAFPVYFMSKTNLNYDRFIDLNKHGAVRFIHSDIQIYQNL